MNRKNPALFVYIFAYAAQERRGGKGASEIINHTLKRDRGF